MDLEQLIFLILALGVAVFSMIRKAKKQMRTTPKEEEADSYFPQASQDYETLESEARFELYDVINSSQNFDFIAKKSQQKQKNKKIESPNIHIENPKNNLQNVDLESDISLLEDFEGTEIQKAFLYSEIFKNSKN